MKINVEGLPSLKGLNLGVNSSEVNFSIRKLPSLKYLALSMSCTIDENIISQLLDQVSHIEHLHLFGYFSHFNLDHLVNLKKLLLLGTINESFDYDLLKNLCNQLEILKIVLTNSDVNKLSGHHFPNLQNFCISNCHVKILKKEFFDRFPMLQNLFINDCNLEEIENDAFSNLKQLLFLDLSKNLLKFIEKNTFSNLKNLQILDLSKNELTNLNAEFIGVRNSAEIFLENDKFKTFYRYWLKLK